MILPNGFICAYCIDGPKSGECFYIPVGRKSLSVPIQVGDNKLNVYDPDGRPGHNDQEWRSVIYVADLASLYGTMMIFRCGEQIRKMKPVANLIPNIFI